jgi:hypothetical protein
MVDRELKDLSQGDQLIGDRPFRPPGMSDRVSRMSDLAFWLKY